MAKRCISACTSVIQAAVETLVRRQEYDFCDGLRAIAVLWVTADHGINYVKAFWPQAGDRLFKLWWPVAATASGEVGVDIFLVLSGFLIGHSLDAEMRRGRGIAVGKFLVRRFFRIFPAIYGAMCVTILANWVFDEPSECPNHKWSTNFFIFNNFPGLGFLGGPETITCLRQTWSVGLEFQLYLVTPLVFWFASAISNRTRTLTRAKWTMALCLLAWASCALVRFIYVLKWDLVGNPPNTWWTLFHFYMPTQFRFSTYAAGVFAGVLVSDVKANKVSKYGGISACRISSRLHSVALAVSCFFLLCACVYGGDFQAVACPTATAWYRQNFPVLATMHAAFLRPLVGASVACILILCALGLAPRLTKCLGWIYLRPIAGLSYSIYLMQFVSVDLLMKPFMLSLNPNILASQMWLVAVAAYVGTALFIVGCFPLAVFNYMFVEYPGILVGKRLVQLLTPARAKDASPASFVETELKTMDEESPPCSEVASTTDDCSCSRPSSMSEDMFSTSCNV